MLLEQLDIFGLERSAEADALRLRTHAIEAANDGIVFCDAKRSDRPIIYASPKFCQFTGYQPEDVLGKSCRFLQGPETCTETLAQMREALRNRQAFVGEILNYRKDGDTFWNLLRIEAILDEAGEVAYFIGIQTDITALRTAQIETQQAHDRLLAAMDSFSGTFALYDDQERIVLYNKEHQRTHEFLGDKLKPGLTFEACMREQLQHGLIEAAVGNEEEWLKQRLERFRNPDGPFVVKKASNYWLRVEEKKLPDGGLLAANVDVSDLKNTEKALRESEKRFKDFADTAADWFWESDADLKLSYLSERYHELTGDEPDRILGTSLRNACATRLMRPDQQQRFSAAVDAGQPFDDVELEYSSNTQRQQYFILSGKPCYDADGNFTGYRGAGTDVTESKRIEAALAEERALLAQRVEERTGELQAANKELARVMCAKDEFLASMSHELRTPLNAILGMSEALQEEVYGDLTDDQHQSVQTIEDSGRHLLALINDVLDVARVGSGELKLHLKDVLVEDVCMASLNLVTQSARKKRLQVVYDLDSAVQEIQVDERRLKQMLVNLLSNAVKFTPEQGRIGLAVEADAPAQEVRFNVWDTGIGISAADRERLFQPFVQVDSSLARQYEGTGLGLALVDNMAKLHGGSVTVQSVLNQGSRFTISLPWQTSKVRASDSDDNVSEQFETSTTNQVLRRALIVDDSAAAADQLSRYLSEFGIQTVVESQGAVAPELAKRTEPDVIILDLNLPDFSGWDVLQRLRSSPETRDIPVIIVSVAEEQERAISLGAKQYLVKPVNRTQLRDSLEKIAPLNPIDQTTSDPGKTENDAATDAVSRREPTLVLLVEDNEANAYSLSQYLEVKQYQVAIAGDGYQALQKADALDPRIILMDIQMPGMDGLETIRRLRSQPRFQETPIVALTALAMPGDEERCLAAGANAYLSKPIRLKELMHCIDIQLASADPG